MKYVRFPWPPVVVAHDHKRLAQALHTGSNHDCLSAFFTGFYKNYPFTQD
jgi:hypothetical protein